MRASITVGIVGAILALAVPASASVSVQAGPGRQYANPDGLTEVLVGNQGDRRVVVHSVSLVNAGGKWSEAPALGFSPEKFTVPPHRQRTVLVSTPGATGPCTLYGAGFNVTTNPGAQVEVHGQVVAQLLVKNTTATEADCLAIIPHPVAASHGTPFPWWIVVMGLAIALLLWGAKRWHSRRQPRRRKAYGF